MTEWQQRTYVNYLGSRNWMETENNPTQSEESTDHLVRRLKTSGPNGEWKVLIDTDDRMVLVNNKSNWTWLWIAWRS